LIIVYYYHLEQREKSEPQINVDLMDLQDKT